MCTSMFNLQKTPKGSETSSDHDHEAQRRQVNMALQRTSHCVRLGSRTLHLSIHDKHTAMSKLSEPHIRLEDDIPVSTRRT